MDKRNVFNEEFVDTQSNKHLKRQTQELTNKPSRSAICLAVSTASSLDICQVHKTGQLTMECRLRKYRHAVFIQVVSILD